MGKSFWLLVWDGWGCGLNMIQPRFFEVYSDKSCITFNSFSYENDSDIEDFLVKHEIEDQYNNFRIIK